MGLQGLWDLGLLSFSGLKVFLAVEDRGGFGCRGLNPNHETPNPA